MKGRLYKYKDVYMLDIFDGWVYLYNYGSCKWERTWFSPFSLMLYATLIGVNYETRR